MVPLPHKDKAVRVEGVADVGGAATDVNADAGLRFLGGESKQTPFRVWVYEPEPNLGPTFIGAAQRKQQQIKKTKRFSNHFLVSENFR